MIGGVVSDIQRFSLHDGPGIRTTVFLKGCLLHCAWCHNPETVHRKPELLFDPAKCLGCGDCASACPNGVHQFASGSHQLLWSQCRASGECTRHCSTGALQLAGRQMSVEEVMAEIREDLPFYGTNGGVTISGGEPLVQPQFTRAILEKCRREGILTAIETSLCYPWSQIEPLIDFFDLMMFDIKIVDPEKHRRYTGGSNRELWRNLEHLNACGKPLIARTPLMAGVNDSENEIAQIAAALCPLSHLLYYELLPYHPLGTGKYEALGRPVPKFSAPSTNTLARLITTVRKAGISVAVAGKKDPPYELPEPN
ncbi:MAG: glycyl-radical enzyme activating protein [Chthoniobacteraceae bacterium]